MAIMNLQRGTSWEKNTCGGFRDEVSAVVGTDGVSTDSSVCFYRHEAVSAASLWSPGPSSLALFLVFGSSDMLRPNSRTKEGQLSLGYCLRNVDLSCELSRGQYASISQSAVAGLGVWCPSCHW